MGCGGSKQASNKADADRYARRKKNNFRDSGLERHRKACVNQKKHLHHVEDPGVQRNQKVAKIKQDQKKKPSGPVGMTETELQRKRKNLKHH